MYSTFTEDQILSNYTIHKKEDNVITETNKRS